MADLVNGQQQRVPVLLVVQIVVGADDAVVARIFGQEAQCADGAGVGLEAHEVAPGGESERQGQPCGTEAAHLRDIGRRSGELAGRGQHLLVPVGIGTILGADVERAEPGRVVRVAKALEWRVGVKVHHAWTPPKPARRCVSAVVSAGVMRSATARAISSGSASVSALTVMLTAFGAMWTPPPDDVPDAATPYPL